MNKQFFSLRYLFVLFTLASLIWSCGNYEVKKMSQQVDSLNIILLQAEDVLANLDTATAYMFMDEISKKLAYIQENTKDSLNKEETIFLSDVYVARKSIKKMMSNYIQIRGQMNYSKHQLENFATDVSNGLVHPEAFEIMHRSESHAMSQLIESVQGLKDWNRIAISNYKRLQQRLDEMKNAL